MVFDKPKGESRQELGGVIVTVLAYCANKELRLDEIASQEMARLNSADAQKMKAKHKTKVDLGVSIRPE